MQEANIVQPPGRVCASFVVRGPSCVCPSVCLSVRTCVHALVCVWCVWCACLCVRVCGVRLRLSVFGWCVCVSVCFVCVCLFSAVCCVSVCFVCLCCLSVRALGVCVRRVPGRLLSRPFPFLLASSLPFSFPPRSTKLYRFRGGENSLEASLFDLCSVLVIFHNGK